jgi:UPF0716 protein FxsA
MALFAAFSGLLLVTPGFVTDAAGFLLLVPSVRALVAKRAWRWLEVRTKTRAGSASEAGLRRPAVIEGEAVEIDTTRDARDPHHENSQWTRRQGPMR